MYYETHVHGNDRGSIFTFLFCAHEYIRTGHSKCCLKCPYTRKTTIIDIANYFFIIYM